MIPKAFTDNLISKTDLAALVAGYVELEPYGAQLRGICPFHRGDKPLFTVAPDKHLWKCFKCGKGGNAIGFIMEIEKKNFPAAVRFLAAKLELEVPGEQE